MKSISFQYHGRTVTGVIERIDDYPHGPRVATIRLPDGSPLRVFETRLNGEDRAEFAKNQQDAARINAGKSDKISTMNRP